MIISDVRIGSYRYGNVIILIGCMVILLTVIYASCSYLNSVISFLLKGQLYLLID